MHSIFQAKNISFFALLEAIFPKQMNFSLVVVVMVEYKEFNAA
jgi:hypothetical protein